MTASGARRQPLRGPRARVRESVERWQALARRRFGARPPAVVLALARPVPGATVRLLPGVLVVGCVALVPDIGTEPWLLALLAAAVAVGSPRSPAVPLTDLLLGLLVLRGGDLLVTGGAGAIAGPWRLAGLLLGLHLLHRTAALAGHVAWGGRVEARVLARAARSMLPVQAVAQGLLLVAVLLRAEVGTPAGDDRVRAVAVLAAVVLAVLVLPPGLGRRARRARRAGAADDPGVRGDPEIPGSTDR